MYYNLPEAPPHMVCSTVYAYTSVSLDLCVSVHVGVGGGAQLSSGYPRCP